MPSTGDQLSKLTGTTMVCTSMCFLMTSLAINGESESISNVIALCLFVVTIAVNICIQIYTGVIFLFIVEHIMILCCMLLLLPVLWFVAIGGNSDNAIINETMKNTLNKGEASSLLHRVKLWYMSSCISNPQYFVKGYYGLSVVMICFLCLTVLSQAALRIVVHKFKTCEGISDYGWSISIIVVTQIMVVLVTSLSAAFRWIVMSSDPPIYMSFDDPSDPSFDVNFEVELFSVISLANNRELSKVSILFSFYFLLKVVLLVAVVWIFLVLGGPLIGIRFIYRKIIGILPALSPACSTRSSTNANAVLEKWETEMAKVFGVERSFPKWMMRSCVEDMNKWTDLSNRSPPNYLVQLLSRPRTRHPPQTLLNKLLEIGINEGYYKLSCLSMVILVKIVALSVPFTLAEPILRALDEAFEIVYYIDEKVNVGNYPYGIKRRFAKVLLVHKNVHLSKKDSTANNLGMSMNEALTSIGNEWEAFPDGVGKMEIQIIMGFIRGQAHASIEELYEDLEQLFVDMLLFFLPQLPIVALKDMNESPIEIREQRARSALKLLCKLKLLEDKVQWSFPKGITRLIDPDDEEEECNNDNMEMHV
ncbi:hypothetical protein Sjap_009457 [Stephania japonica]|uniref:Uncharacterized protein n=1 Tax=Stephania japonica TaxID=461633 RepID=A0AAP0PBR2_9MAGN